MLVRSAAALVLALGLASLAAAAPPGPKVKFPSKMGIYAMTGQGPVELKVSGEPDNLPGVINKTFYSADSFARIPSVDSVRSFYVSAMGWTFRRAYLVVGRDALVDAQTRFQLCTAGTISRGVVAFEVVSSDFQSAPFIREAVRKLAPAGAPEADLEVYLVLELRNTEGLNARNYPVRIGVPAK